MSTYEQLPHLQATWPETTDYLTRVGQVNNDLMVLREIAARDSAAVTWMDRLVIEPEDLLATPTAMSLAKHLHQSGEKLRALAGLPEYLEDQAEQEQLFLLGETSVESVLDDPGYQLTPTSDAQLWESPELVSMLIEWATGTASRVLDAPIALSVAQATIVFRLFQFLEQEPATPGLVEESLRSLLSSEFFAIAGTPPTSK